MVIKGNKTKEMKTVTVLLSTYNGQQYISEQLESLLTQKDINVEIVIRDDGSSDSTLQIIDQYCNKYDNITLLKCLNCGCEESFHELCRYASLNCESDFYAFCDQDDVWDDDKLIIAVKKLMNYPQDMPNLYFSNMRMVDSNLHYIRDYYATNEISNYLEKSLIQIFTFGCTCVFNKRALELYVLQKDNKAYHDNWIYIICALYGNVYYDKTPHINYRQHSSNLSGEKKTGFKLFIQRFRKMLRGSNSHVYETIAKQIKANYPNTLSPKVSKRLKLLTSYRHSFKNKLILLLFNKYQTSNLMKNLCIKYRIINNIL